MKNTFLWDDIFISWPCDLRIRVIHDLQSLFELNCCCNPRTLYQPSQNNIITDRDRRWWLISISYPIISLTHNLFFSSYHPLLSKSIRTFSKLTPTPIPFPLPAHGSPQHSTDFACSFLHNLSFDIHSRATTIVLQSPLSYLKTKNLIFTVAFA